jgi:hypothetical protein
LDSRFTRRRFLAAASAGAAYLALTGTVGSETPERSSKVRSSRTPGVKPLPGVPFPPDGVWAFRSRPDLKAPAVEVATEARAETAPGYIFVAPEKGGAGKGGSMIIDDRGQVVWFHPLRGPYGRAMNFETQTYQGRDVLTWGQTPGEYKIFEDSYREIARFTAANGYDGDHHEFLLSPQDTALITIYNAVPQDLSSVGGVKDSVAIQGIVQELDINTGEVLFEWRSIEHVALEETYVRPSEDHYPGIDYFHLNSIDIEPDNNLLISARETSAVYKIDRKTGEVMWRLGGKNSDFEMGEGTHFAFQHDARRLPDGTVSIFDNGSLIFENGTPKALEESRAIVLKLDEERMRASLVRQYTHPDKQYADAAGNMQVLPNGNVFIGWGRGLAISEFSEDGELLFDLRVSPEHRSYRAFRFPWSGSPSDQPACVAERTSENELELYASWNGATEVESWEVLVGPHPGQLESVGSVPRDGFETAMLVQTSEPYVAVRARHRSGRVLGDCMAVLSKHEASQHVGTSPAAALSISASPGGAPEPGRRRFVQRGFPRCVARQR